MTDDERIRLLVPAYVHPVADPSGWSALERLGADGAFVVVNVDNGPGREVDRVFVDGVERLVAAGVVVLGYVHARWGARPPGEVARDACRWLDGAPVHGVFVDEAAPGPAFVGHHSIVARRARAHGARWVLANPGAAFHPGYLDVFDAVGSFEGPIEAHNRHEPAPWTLELAAGRCFHLVHGVDRACIAATMERMRRSGITTGFVTDGHGEPWTYVPSYLDAVRRLARRPAA